MSADYDIAVVGGGLAGASLACALADTGLSIALIEAAPLDAEPDAAAAQRTTAIAWGTRVLFERLGLWSAMADSAAAIKRLHVSEQGRFGRVRVAAADYGVAALGYVVPNTAMLAALRARLAEIDTVEIIAPARFESLCHRSDDRIDLVLSRGGDPPDTRALSTRLLIGADGARSAVRASLGIGAHIDDYHQRAIITTVESQRPHDGCAYERFTPDGPIALLPRSRTRCAAVWTRSEQAARDVLALDETAFARALQSAFGQRLGALALAGPRGSYPLARVVCEHAVARRAALIGNAGHTLHPAAAQGFNLAVRDALVFAAMLRERMTRHPRENRAGFDPGDADLLAAWAEARRPDQRRVADFTDAIVRVFSNRIPGLGPARAAGLFGLSLAAGVRDDMARRSMGLALAPIFDAPGTTTAVGSAAR